MAVVREAARIRLPTLSGEFTRAFECASGHVYLAMIKGVRLTERSVHLIGDQIIIAGRLAHPG